MQDERAYQEWWFRFYSFKKADKYCENLKEARQALFLSMKTVGARLGMSAQGYSRLEEADLEGSISIENLRRCAKALNCDVFIEIKPAKSFSFQIWQAVVAKVHRPRTQSALAFRVGKRMFDPWLRRQLGWIRNTEVQAQGYAREYNRMHGHALDPTCLHKPET